MTIQRRLMVYNWLSTLLPEFRIFRRIRKALLRWSGVVVPHSADLCGTVHFEGDGEIILGENSTIGTACFLYAQKGGRIELGPNVKLEGNVFLHVSEGGRIIVGRNVKLARNVTIECLAKPPICETMCRGRSGEIVIGENSIIRKGSYLKVRGGGLIKLGRNAKIAENVILESLAKPSDAPSLIFGEHVDFMMGSIASANGNSNVKIGDNCKIAHNVSIKATEHKIDPNGKCIGGDVAYRDITISEGCWICGGATVIPGVTIGKRNVIAAGAVVIRGSPDNVLLAGVPAIVKKKY